MPTAAVQREPTSLDLLVRQLRLDDLGAGRRDLADRLLVATCVIFSIAVIVFMIGPASSHVVLWYALGFEAAGAIWYVVAVRSRPRRGEAGPGLHQDQPATVTAASS